MLLSYNSIWAILLSMLAWTLFYWAVVKMLPCKQSEYCNRCVVLVHGLIITCLGLMDYRRESGAFDKLQEPTTDDQKLIILISTGYFYFDLCWCLLCSSETKLMIAHHVYSCIVLTRMLYRPGGAAFVVGLTGMEATNPLLQLRWLIRSEGYHNTWMFKAVELTFIVLFFFIRVVLGTYWAYTIFFVSPYDFEFIVMTAMIYTISFMFMVNIFRYFVHKYMAKAESETEPVEMPQNAT